MHTSRSRTVCSIYLYTIHIECSILQLSQDLEMYMLCIPRCIHRIWLSKCRCTYIFIEIMHIYIYYIYVHLIIIWRSLYVVQRISSLCTPRYIHSLWFSMWDAYKVASFVNLFLTIFIVKIFSVTLMLPTPALIIFYSTGTCHILTPSTSNSSISSIVLSCYSRAITISIIQVSGPTSSYC